ncbi:3-carboxy-cis,cis-muconate cycloisomerase (plasmid) [Deinococcus geothermalis DSM 11300]|uniref:3-carboxy-cis,cis-muconate cycloisomerase n=1 Tax=Deinococcus geothermalis (strain DSM 11300 / CIP 105573 / AG-3a) TaxID=319795 RepID=Q1J3Z8_DEIGD|nr:3-carboxy-cis,cis-muconate cycloisomerase [Deinococcus geothermalis]ABF43820.1 3-carboxy-cis,cis-muconate cycloisomerase [Deinococcus geothermalis DSM 11300]
MPLTPADSALFGSLFAQPEVAALFTDEVYVRRLLTVEGALASVQGRLGIIPPESAEAILHLTQTFSPDLASLRAGLLTDGVPVSALLAQLRPALPAAARDHLHFGATTQDIVDTAFVLAAREALRVLRRELLAVGDRLAELSQAQAQTLMPGRTHSQQALPVTFGLKAAGWLTPLTRHLERLRELEGRLYVVSFGGAAGTLAALGDRGLAVADALAAELDLAAPPTPWHTQRDTVFELAAWLAGVGTSLGKLAQDVILLAQSEVGEVREGGGGGGSSTMPQKQNPITSEVILAAASTNAGLLAAVARSGVQEHERGTHGWQVEWLTVPQMLGLIGAALAHTRRLLDGLEVQAARMAHNVAASHGLMLAEALSFALTAVLPKEEAKALIRQAVPQALAGEGHLVGLVRERLGPRGARVDWAALTEAHTLGSTFNLIDRAIRHYRQVRPSCSPAEAPPQSSGSPT